MLVFVILVLLPIHLIIYKFVDASLDVQLVLDVLFFDVVVPLLLEPGLLLMVLVIVSFEPNLPTIGLNFVLNHHRLVGVVEAGVHLTFVCAADFVGEDGVAMADLGAVHRFGLGNFAIIIRHKPLRLVVKLCAAKIQIIVVH